jgi:hypothetical protein
MGLERGTLSLVSTTEELLGRNSRGCGLESRHYGSGDPVGGRDGGFMDGQTDKEIDRQTLVPQYNVRNKRHATDD